MNPVCWLLVTELCDLATFTNLCDKRTRDVATTSRLVLQGTRDSSSGLGVLMIGLKSTAVVAQKRESQEGFQLAGPYISWEPC